MMNFRTITTALNALLASAAAGRYTVAGHRRQTTSAEEVRASKRLVQVYYAGGDFPKSGGGVYGVVKHGMTFAVGCTLSMPAMADLATLTNPLSTPQQRATALLAITEASAEADTAMDELFEIIYQVLMDPRNADLGLPVGTVASRWVDQMIKDDPQPEGSLVVLTGKVVFTCSTSEEVTGEVGVTITGGISTVVDLVGDDVEKTGVDAE